MNEAKLGVIAIATASLIWGLSPLLYKSLSHVDPVEVLAHRTVWSCIFLLALAAGQGRLKELKSILANRRSRLIVILATMAITINWFVFILSIQVGMGVEASLGYYIFPLVAVLLGAIFLGERLSNRRWFAVGLAGLAVSMLTFRLGTFPTVSLVLAVSFGLYGITKKKLLVNPLLSVAAELVVITPITLLFLIGVHLSFWTGISENEPAVFGKTWVDSLLLMFSGPVTSLPLVLFSYASKRVSYATVGLVQYLNPTVQAAVAVFVFKEAFTGAHMFAFALIWCALALYSSEAFGLKKT